MITLRLRENLKKYNTLIHPQSLEKLDAVTGKTEAINKTATAKASRATGSGYTNSTTLMYSIQLFTTMAQSVDVDQIGSNSTLKELSQESFSNNNRHTKPVLLL